MLSTAAVLLLLLLTRSLHAVLLLLLLLLACCVSVTPSGVVESASAVAPSPVEEYGAAHALYLDLADLNSVEVFAGKDGGVGLLWGDGGVGLSWGGGGRSPPLEGCCSMHEPHCGYFFVSGTVCDNSLHNSQ